MLKVLFFFIPRANPDNDPKLYLVRQWLIEFDDEGVPEREVGLGVDGKPVFAAPDKRNWGFWVDSDMTFSSFERNEITVEEFDQAWAECLGSMSQGRVAS